MDQLVPVIEFLKKNKFWLTCGLVAIASLAMWFVSSAKLDKETKANEAKIKSSISTAENIQKVSPEGADDVPRHPNTTTVSGMETEISEAADAVVEAWKLRYEAQKPVRVWPDEVLKNPDFGKFVKQFDPPETFPVDQTGANFLSYLTIYKQQIPKQMANIVAKAKTNWMFDKADTSTSAPGNADASDRGSRPGAGGVGGRDGRGGRGAGSGLEVADESTGPKPVVVWNKDNQEYWNTKLTEFKGRDDHKLNTDDPSPMQVFMLQQDLWLLEAMFDIIGQVNGDDAIANDLATIKQIDHIAFGRSARAVLGQVREPVAISGGATGGSGSSTTDSGAPAIEGRGRARSGLQGAFRKSSGASFPDDKFNSPFHGRYVDENFEPITADVVRKVLTDKDLPEKNLELIVAKRVPVRLALVMDETKINEFVAACANSPFTFEIHQIRINKHKPGEGIELKGGNSKAKSKGRGGQREGDNLAAGGGAGSGAERADGGSGTQAKGDGVQVGEVDTRNNFDVKVEFYGIVKIYNKVDAARLTGEKKAEPTKP